TLSKFPGPPHSGLQAACRRVAQPAWQTCSALGAKPMTKHLSPPGTQARAGCGGATRGRLRFVNGRIVACCWPGKGSRVGLQVKMGTLARSLKFNGTISLRSHFEQESKVTRASIDYFSAQARRCRR